MFKKLFIFLVITNCLVSAEDDYRQIIEKSQQLSPEERLQYYIEQAEEQLNINDENSLLLSNRAIKLADSLDDESFEARARIIAGMVWGRRGDNSKSADNFFHALNYYEISENINQIAFTTRSIGEMYRAASQPENAISYLNRSYSLYQELDKPLELAKTANRLAAVYYEKTYTKNAYQDNYKAIMDQTISLDSLLKENPLINNYIDSTNKYLKISNKIANQQEDYRLIVSNKIIEASLEKTFLNFDTALKIYKETETLLNKNKVDDILILLQYNIASFYLYEGNLDRALEYALISKKSADEREILTYRFMSAGLLSEIYNKMGDFKTASHYTHESYQLQIEFFKNNIEAALKSVNYENEIEVKKEELDFLAQRNTIIIISFVIFVLILSVFLVVLSRKNKIQKELNASLKESNDLINVQNEKLELVNAEKDKFFSIVAHDLKNPIGSFKMSLGMLNKEFDSFEKEDIKEIVGLLNNSAENVSELLENLLDWSRTQRGKIKFNPVPTDLNSITQITFSLLTLSADEKKVALKNEIPMNTFVHLDANLITTVIRNLVTNAIKFCNEDGEITIGLKEYDDEKVIFFIKDTGVGIPEETQGKLFRIDQNVTTLGTNEEKGTGLGLILCKEFVEMHEGKISLESEVGVGTTFYIMLPKREG